VCRVNLPTRNQKKKEEESHHSIDIINFYQLMGFSCFSPAMLLYLEINTHTMPRNLAAIQN
jgi:hypothetical protein